MDAGVFIEIGLGGWIGESSGHGSAHRNRGLGTDSGRVRSDGAQGPWNGDLGTWERCGVNRVRGRGCGDSKTATHDLGGGGAEGIRTPDLLIANETLYQLSYDPVPKRR